MTTEAEARASSPYADYCQRMATLTAIAERLTDPKEQAVMLDAIDSFRGRHESHARFEEEQVHTRYYCGICYHPIPYGDEVRMRGDHLGRRAHKSCEHIYYHDMAAVRKKIKTGALHAPGTCYFKDKCPFFQHIPTMADKVPATWTERI